MTVARGRFVPARGSMTVAHGRFVPARAIMPTPRGGFVPARWFATAPRGSFVAERAIMTAPRGGKTVGGAAVAAKQDGGGKERSCARTRCERTTNKERKSGRAEERKSGRAEERKSGRAEERRKIFRRPILLSIYFQKNPRRPQLVRRLDDLRKRTIEMWAGSSRSE